MAPMTKRTRVEGSGTGLLRDEQRQSDRRVEIGQQRAEIVIVYGAVAVEVALGPTARLIEVLQQLAEVVIIYRPVQVRVAYQGRQDVDLASGVLPAQGHRSRPRRES